MQVLPMILTASRGGRIFEQPSSQYKLADSGQDQNSKSRQEIGDARNSRIDSQRVICLFESDGMGARATVN
jgi:hypothetical protein